MQQDAPDPSNGSGNSSGAANESGNGTGTELGDQIQEQVGGGPGGSGNESANESGNETAAEAGSANDSGVGVDVESQVGAGPGSSNGTANESANETGNATASDGGAGSGGDGGGGFSTTGTPRDGSGSASSGDGGGLLGFDVESYVKESLGVLRDGLQELGAWAFDAVIELIVGTGAPDRIVGPPTNEPWLTLYNYAQGDVATIAMILFAFVIVSIGAAGTFAGILSTYETRQLWWRAGLALVFNFFWWPIGAAGLQVIDWLAVNIAPSGAEFTSSIEGAIAGAAGAAIAGAVLHTISTGAILLLGLLYGARWIALAGLLVFMPILVMLWVVDASIFSRLSNLASGFMGMFVPLLVMPLPTAMLMRVALLFFMAAASGNAGILSGPVLVFMALGTLVASVFAPKFTFDYARSFMAQSFGAEKIGKQLDAQLGALGAGIADGVKNAAPSGSGSGSGTASVLETPPALPPADPTAAPSTGSGGSGAPAAPATEPVTATGSTASTTATAASASGPAASANTPTSTSSSAPTTTATGTTTEDQNVNKYLQESEYSVDEQRIESRRRQLRRDSGFYGADD